MALMRVYFDDTRSAHGNAFGLSCILLRTELGLRCSLLKLAHALFLKWKANAANTLFD